MIVFGVELKDQVSLNANRASEAMLGAADQAKVLGNAMKATQAAMAKAVALSDVAKVKLLSAQYQQLKESFQGVEPALLQQQTAMKAAAEAAKAEAKALEESRAAAKKAADDIAKAFAELAEKAEQLKKNSAIGLGAVAAVGVATAAVLYEGGKMALEASENVKRLTATFDALGNGAPGAGAATLSMLRSLEKEVPESEATVASWARTLEGAGVTDLGSLRNDLKAVAAAEALVEGGGEHVKNMLAKLEEQSLKGGGKVKFSLAQLAGTGVSESEFLGAIGMTPANFAAAKKAGTLGGRQVSDAISKALATKASGALSAQMGELATLETKAADAAKHLFEGVDTEPLTAGVRDLFGIFDDAQPSGQVMKAAITGAFNAIFVVANKVLGFIRTAFLETIILALQVAIAIKHHPALFEAIGAVIAGSVIGAIVALTVFTWGYVTAAAAAAVAVLAATWPFLLIGAAIGLVIFGIYELVKHWAQIKEFFGNLAAGAIEAAANFVEGLVNGITNGVGRAVAAVKHLGTSVINGLKNLLGIHSPSTVMFEFGARTSEGFAGGITAGGGNVEAATSGMAGAAASGAGRGASGGSRGGAGGGGRAVVHIDHLQIDGSKAVSPGEMRQIVEEELASLAERIALMIGAAPEPA